jgi:hypothetical protein
MMKAGRLARPETQKRKANSPVLIAASAGLAGVIAYFCL